MLFEIFKPLRYLKVLLILLQNDYLFFQMDFLSVKSTFKPLKRDPKQTIKNTFFINRVFR
jgi:hypothetical protein